MIVSPGDRASGASEKLTLAWVGEDALEARFAIQKAGMYLGAVRLGNGTVLPLAPITLPYSPEFEPRPDPAEGRQTLQEMARITGGIERTTWNDAFTAIPFRNRQVRDLVWPLALTLLVLHVIEIGGRRLLLFAAVREWWRRVKLPRLRLPKWRFKRPASAQVPPTAPIDVAPDQVARVAPPKPAVSPLARAKARARGRLGR